MSTLKLYFADERIAVDYLHHQSGRGDLASPIIHPEIGPVVPEIETGEEQCDTFVDATICDASDINTTSIWAPDTMTTNPQPTNQPTSQPASTVQQPHPPPGLQEGDYKPLPPSSPELQDSDSDSPSPPEEVIKVAN